MITTELLQAHNLAGIPALIILFVAMTLIFGIIGFMVVKKSKEKFMIIWGTSALFNVVILLGLIFLPNVTQTIANIFRGGN